MGPGLTHISLDPSSSWRAGQLAASTTSQALAASPVGVKWNAGILVTNCDVGVTVYLSEQGAATSSNGYPLLAGASVVVPISDPSQIQVLAASGTPLVGWLAAS